jgi:fructose-bisphosphate aldolase class II
MRKINVGPAQNTAFTGAEREVLGERPGLVDPRAYLGPGREAAARTVAHFLSVIAG